MSTSHKLPINTKAGAVADPWTELRRLTSARIALGRTGVSLPSREMLAQSLAHSRARDAIEVPLDIETLRSELKALRLESISIRSQAASRAQYLVRPDLGRRVFPADLALLSPDKTYDAVFVLSDGLSSAAVQRHAVPLLRVLLSMMDGITLAPIVIATQARVALADEVGDSLRARLAVSFIGERPGLSSLDSLGLYVTYAPAVGKTDEVRNCISNIRPEGLSFESAAHALLKLIKAALASGATGIMLQSKSTLMVDAPTDLP